MVPKALLFTAVLGVSLAYGRGHRREPRPLDPCTVIAGQKWVDPSAVRACMSSFPVDPQIKQNTLDVITKTLAFHTSTNYQILAPPPFSADVHEDVLASLARIANQTYANDFDLHVDLSRTLKRLNDGHCVYINACYDALYVTYIPLPLVFLTKADGTQAVHIAPEAFQVASAEFYDQMSYWQSVLPGHIQGQLSSLSGAEVRFINGDDPLVAVDKNAGIAGGYQALGTRQNGFFASYFADTNGWNYLMGNFAQQSLPLLDFVELTVIPINSSVETTFRIPYRSRFNSNARPFRDAASYRANNCKPVSGTNGENLNAKALSSSPPSIAFQPIAPYAPAEARKHPMNVVLDADARSNIALPFTLKPTTNIPASAGVAQFFLLDDGKTGVLALGSFSASSFEGLQRTLLNGLLQLKGKGAQRLIVDVTNNGGGYICIAHVRVYLKHTDIADCDHIAISSSGFIASDIIGPGPTTVPQAGFDSEARAGPLAQLIAQNIIEKRLDRGDRLLYNPINWRDASNTPFPADRNWLQPPVSKIINGRKDAFSPRLGQECQPFDLEAPKEALFEPSKIVIVSNGRCASSCSIFSITMAKEDGVKTVVFGGRKDVRQQYCGTVGGQSTDFSTIDTEIKTALLKGHPLSPPDFLTNSILGITWRLGFGIDNRQEPEEWQNHLADYQFPLTLETVNNPVAIWKAVGTAAFGHQ